MKKAVGALFLVGVILLTLNLLKILGGILLLVLSIICLLVAAIIGLVSMVK